MLAHSGRFAVYTVVQPVFPSLLQATFSGDRLQIAETVWNVPGRKAIGPGVIASALVLILGAILTAAAIRDLVRARRRLPLVLFGLCVALYALYAGINVLGRMNLRPGPDILSSNCYYTYPALLFALLAAGVALPALGNGVGVARARAGLLAGLAALSLFGAEQVRKVNEDVARGLTDVTRPVRLMHQFVKDHAHELDFSFAVDHAGSDHMRWIYGIPVDRIVFPHYTRAAHPKYRVALRDGKVVVLPGPDGTAGTEPHAR
jgi:hypothetical protein